MKISKILAAVAAAATVAAWTAAFVMPALADEGDGTRMSRSWTGNGGGTNPQDVAQ